MEIDEEQINGLRSITPSISFANEGGYNYILIVNFKLPVGCNPPYSDILICPQARDGYESRIYFPSKITCRMSPNWNGQINILDRNWFAYSWKTKPGLTLVEMLVIHLKALR